MSLKKRSPSLPKFKLACLGGSFDHFHKGHEAFLDKAFGIAQKVIVGLTSDDFVKNKVLSQTVLPFKKRKEELKNFLSAKGFLKRAQIIKIEGPLTPKILDSKVECLVVSEKTRKKAKVLNKKRIENSLPPLKVVVAPFISDKNGRYISSTRIRLGEIDREGKPLASPDFFKKTLFLPPKLRPVLKKPLGELISSASEKNERSEFLLGSERKLRQATLELKKRLKDPPFLITVGDVVTLSLMKEGIFPNLSIVDFKVGRKKIYQNIGQLGFSSDIAVKEVENESGTLNPALFLAIKQGIKSSLSFKKPLVIKVLGEEDLAVLPAVLLSPLGSLVLYGQPKEGIVAIKVTEEKKKEVKRVLRRFQEKERE